MALVLHCSNTFWICWVILIRFEGQVDALEISKALGGVTKSVPLVRERQVQISSYMNFHYSCFILAFMLVTESCFTCGCKDHIRTAGFLGWGHLSSQGRREGTTGDLDLQETGSWCSASHFLRRGLSVVSRVLWRRIPWSILCGPWTALCDFTDVTGQQSWFLVQGSCFDVLLRVSECCWLGGWTSVR